VAIAKVATNHTIGKGKKKKRKEKKRKEALSLNKGSKQIGQKPPMVTDHERSPKKGPTERGTGGPDGP
jgi:hypothetical protein